MKRVIVVDVDGVLADFNHAFHTLLRKVFGAPMTPFESPIGPVCWSWPKVYGATAQQKNDAWAFVAKTPSFWEDLERMPDANDAAAALLKKLIDQEEVYFVTSRPKGLADATDNWLWDKMGVHSNVIVASDSSTGAKASIFSGIHPDVVIEDKPENLLTEWPHDELCTKILVQRPWNASRWSDPRLLLCRGTESAMELVFARSGELWGALQRDSQGEGARIVEAGYGFGV